MAHMAGFFHDMFANVGFKGFTGNQVNLAAKKFFQSLLKPQKSDKSDWLGKFNEDVNIAVRALVTPSERSKQSHVGNCMLLLQFRQMLVEEISNLFASFGLFCVHSLFITWASLCRQQPN